MGRATYIIAISLAFPLVSNGYVLVDGPGLLMGNRRESFVMVFVPLGFGITIRSLQVRPISRMTVS